MRRIIEELKRLGCGWILGMFRAKLLCDSARFHFGRIHFEILGDGCGLVGSEQALAEFRFAQMRLVHLGCGGNDAKRNLLVLPHLSQPFAEAWCSRPVSGLFLSSHVKASYIAA